MHMKSVNGWSKERRVNFKKRKGMGFCESDRNVKINSFFSARGRNRNYVHTNLQKRASTHEQGKEKKERVFWVYH